ncbi:helix-turn-helix domain-containing protein [Noviherbaspirillum album]|uniref:helix-turn-helix domain-containing protein n=1 Tax=Noviherbaspirillum album TaxID=3080276 RepID=UPI003460E328
MASIGDRIKQVRLQRGMRQGELARRVGVSQATLSQLESNGSQSTKVVAKLAAVLGVSAYWLSEGRGDPQTGVSAPAQQPVPVLPSPKVLRLAEKLARLPPEKLAALSVLLGVDL